MNDDDPEKRIADLERRLAARPAVEARAENQGYSIRPGSATGDRLTPEQVRNVAFSKPPIGKRGYNEDEVDALLARVEEALQDPLAHPLTADQIRNVAFSKPPIGKRGYSEDEVDAFLDLVEAQMSSGQGGLPPPPPSLFVATPTGSESPTKHERPQSRGRRFLGDVSSVSGRIFDFPTDPE
jgi:DivIVA domain-containing protein